MPAAKKKAVSSDALLAEALTADTTAVPVVVEPGAVPARRPDITPAQIIGSVPIVANLLSAFGVFALNAAQQSALQDTLAYALALLGADAVIRFGRNLARR